MGRFLHSILLVSAILATLALSLGVQWLHNDYGLAHEREDCPALLITLLFSSGLIATAGVALFIAFLGALRFSRSSLTLPVVIPLRSARSPPW